MDYLHHMPPSFESRLIQSLLGLFRMKKKMERRMVDNSFAKDPAKLPESLSGNCTIREMDQNGRKVWTISPVNNATNLVILYLHGGAYMGNISKEHWNLMERLVTKTSATIVVPDYPLAPEALCQETYSFIFFWCFFFKEYWWSSPKIELNSWGIPLVVDWHLVLYNN